MTESKLLPCPFCGDTNPKVVPPLADYSPGMIFCGNQKCPANVTYDGSVLGPKAEISALRKGWNTRPTPTRTPEVALAISMLQHTSFSTDEQCQAWLAVAAYIQSLEASQTPVQALREALQQAVQNFHRICEWRKSAHHHDDDMGHSLRDFGDEDWEQLENFAVRAGYDAEQKLLALAPVAKEG